MADFKAEYESSASLEAMDEIKNKFNWGDPGSLIHPSFPSEGIVQPSHLGSQSKSPIKNNRDSSKGDIEEDYPYSSSGSPGKWREQSRLKIQPMSKLD